MDSIQMKLLPYTGNGGRLNLLFKQMKQNFPLKYFYGESANAIKIRDMGDSYRKPVVDGYAERSETPMELLRLGNNGQNHADVLR